jgi:hypothetical protein
MRGLGIAEKVPVLSLRVVGVRVGAIAEIEQQLKHHFTKPPRL